MAVRNYFSDDPGKSLAAEALSFGAARKAGVISDVLVSAGKGTKETANAVKNASQVAMSRKFDDQMKEEK